MSKVPAFKRRSGAETLADSLLPQNLSAKQLLSARAKLDHVLPIDPYFSAIISGGSAAATEHLCGTCSHDADGAAAKKTEKMPSCAFSPIRLPKNGDWLRDHHEEGQSVARFISRSETYAQPHGPFNTIALVIIGEGFSTALLAKLKKYISAFFMLNVEIVGPYNVDQGDAVKIQRRVHPDTGLQLFAGDCIQFCTSVVNQNRDLCRRTVCKMGVTMYDLTPREEWNFVYGLAYPLESSGCFSMCRFSPSFNEEKVQSPEAVDQVIFERCCKVVSHEITHLFGVKHCVHYKCLMNGVNHIGELREQPLLECPLCCKKLSLQIGWDLGERFKAVSAVMEEFGFEEAAVVRSMLLPTFLATTTTTITPTAPAVSAKVPSVVSPRVKRPSVAAGKAKA